MIRNLTASSGLVVAAHGRRGVLESGGTRHPFVPKGRDLRVVCGDHVRFEARPGSEAMLVTAIEPRSNALARIHGQAERDEVIAANVTQLVAVCAATPEPDPFLLDRHACAAELMGCRFALVWNKADLDGVVTPAVADLAALGYPLLRTSTRTGAGIDALAATLAGQTSVLVGQSGVGKSSLINALFADANAAVGELSAGAAAGTHTTTAVLMYARDPATRLLDTPGVRDFLPSVRTGQRLDGGFRDIFSLAGSCRFANCRHLQEPGCAVKAAADSARLSPRRYESYRRLLGTLGDGARRPGAR